MRLLPRSILMAATLLAASPVLAQGAPVTFATKADIAAAIAKAAATLKPGQTVLMQPMLAFGTYHAILEYRTGAAAAAVHEGQDEMFEVVEGSGTLMQGGTLVQGPAGATVSGGTARHVAAGDAFVVLAGTPHGFPQVDGHLALLTTKVPAK